MTNSFKTSSEDSLDSSLSAPFQVPFSSEGALQMLCMFFSI